MVLQTIAHFHGNILTIHQSIPINGVASLTLSVDILPGEGDAEAMVDEIERQDGVHYLKITWKRIEIFLHRRKIW